MLRIIRVMSNVTIQGFLMCRLKQCTATAENKFLSLLFALSVAGHRMTSVRQLEAAWQFLVVYSRLPEGASSFVAGSKRAL